MELCANDYFTFKKKIKNVLTNYVYLVSIFTMADFFFSG